MNRLIRALAPLMLIATPALAQGTMTEAEQAAVQLALKRGQLLYQYDQAAWHGTDDMVRKLMEPEKTVGGWIVDGDGATPELVFYDKDTADPHAVYVARFEGSRLVSGRVLGEGEDRSLSPMRKRMIAALAAAREALAGSGAGQCVDRPFNTVVLPPETADAPILVYFLTPQTDDATLPFGGHYRFEVSADGKAGPIRRFTNSCIALPIGDAKDKKDKDAGLFITHLLDPVPTEIHVFSARAARQTVYVVTGDRLWSIVTTTTGSMIVLNRQLDQGSDKP